MWAKSCHLLCELWDGGHVVGVLTSRGERGEGGNEEVETREGYHVNRQLPKVCVQLKNRGENHFKILRTRFLVFQRDFFQRRTSFLISFIWISRDF